MSIENRQKTDNYLWYLFETAIDEQFLGGGSMPTVEAPYQELADALGNFWQHAVRPRVQAMMLLATHPLFAKHPYQTSAKDDGVAITITPATKWFGLEIVIASHALGIHILGDKHTAYSDGLFFDRKGLVKAEKLLAWHGQSHPGEHLTLFDEVEHTAIPDYTMLLHAMVARGVEICQSLENAVVTTVEQFENNHKEDL